MATFVVIPRSPEAADEISAIIASEFPDSLRTPSGDWLLSARGTSEQVSKRLTITGGDGKGPSAIVFAISGYYGRGPSSVWEWLKEKMEAGAGA